MGYNPGRCWGDLNLATLKCPLAAFKRDSCPGGYECEHRGNTDARQCQNAEATPLGLCIPCYERKFGNVELSCDEDPAIP